MGTACPAAYKLLIAFLLGPCLLLSQKFPVMYLDIGQGLSNNSVMNIYQDSDGYMWFGTYDGLNRYDGYEFKIFRNNIGDTNSILSNTVYSIEGDSSKNIWVGGQNGGCVYRQATASFATLKYTQAETGKSAPLTDIIHQIKTVDNKTVLIGCQNLGLLFCGNNSRMGKQIPFLIGGRKTYGYDVTAIETVPGENFCWLFIRQAGLFKFGYNTKKLQPVNTQLKQVNCIKSDGKGNLWLGTDEGLCRYIEKTGEVSASFLTEKTKVTSIIKARNGDLWMGTDGKGVWNLQEGGDKALPFNKEVTVPLVKSNAVWVIYEDRDGRKWFGTLRGGVSMMAPSPSFFSHVTYDQRNITKPADNFILSFCEGSDGHILVGTDGAGLRYWNRQTNGFSTIAAGDGKKNISSNFITGIIRDDNNDVWLSTWFGGVNRIRKNGTVDRFRCFNPTTGQEELNTWLVFKDSRQRIWASATNPGCLYLFNRKKEKFELLDGSLTNVQCLTEAKDGTIWAGNYQHLIAIDSGGKKYQRFNIGYAVRSLLEDSSGQFWVGTQEGGLLLFNRKLGTFKRYTVQDGLPNNTVLRLLQDKQGSIWMTTYNGLSRFDPKLNSFQNFSQSDGLQSNQFSFNAGLALSSGEFLFGGINGFNIFYPDKFKGVGRPPKLLLSGLTINNAAVESDTSFVTQRVGGEVKSIQIPFDQANVSLDFVALNYGGTDKMNYAYYLEGWDKAWNYVGKTRRANYNRLYEGSYTFKVKVSDSYGKWDKESSLLIIEVMPPWFRSWWAYVLYIISAGAILYLYVFYTRRQERLKYQFQLAQLENEKERELTERQLSMFTNISHEFRSPLSLIINPLKKAISGTTGQESLPRDNDLVVAHRNAKRLLGLVDQLLLFRKADSGADQLAVAEIDLVGLCDEIYQCFKSQAKEKNIDYKFYGAENQIQVFGDFEKIEIALFNLLSNAFKFTPQGGKIVIQLTNNFNVATLQVSDTGPGIPKDEMDKIFEKFSQGGGQPSGKSGFGIGLYLARHFIEKHQGTITCKSEVGLGTVFTINLLKGKAHLAGNVLKQQPLKKTELIEELLNEEESITAGPSGKQWDSGASADDMVTTRQSVLVVDDNEEIRNYLNGLFRSKYLVYTANDGEDGLRQAGEILPDLIISDISMAAMDGLELCRRIKQSETLGHIPIVLLTATTNPDTKLKGISGGADDFITKPFDSDILMARVETLLKSRTQLRKYFLDSITLKENNQKVPLEEQEFLRRCIEVIEAEIGREEFNIKSFSKAMGMSHSALYTRIKTISGQTVNGFIRSIRLRRAAVLMLTENMNVTQAGFQVGFDNARYFREQFSKLFGMIPSEYIKKYRHSFNKDLNVIRSVREN